MNVLSIIYASTSLKSGLYYASLNRTHNSVITISVQLKETFFSKIASIVFRKRMILDKDSFDYNNKTIFVEHIKYSRITKKFSKKSMKALTERFISLIEQYDINFIDAHWGYPHGTIARMLSQKSGIPYSITFHGSDLHTIPFKNNFIQEEIIDNIKKSKLNIYVSHALRDNLPKLGIKIHEKKDLVIPNGIDNKLFRINDNDLYRKLDNETISVIFVGNLIPVKNVFSLIDFFQAFKSIYDNVNFIVVGDGPLKSELNKALITKDIKASFLGHIRQDELADIYKKSNFIVLPSYEEGWPCVLLEAMSCGVIPIGSNIPSIREVLNGNGELVDIKKDIKSQVQNYLSSKNIKSFQTIKELIGYTEQFHWLNINNLIKHKMEEVMDNVKTVV